jgi:hypothetical protein
LWPTAGALNCHAKIHTWLKTTCSNRWTPANHYNLAIRSQQKWVRILTNSFQW